MPNDKPQAPAQPFGTFGAIALAFGVGVLAAYTLDVHSHQCDGCGNTWWHLGAFKIGDARAHRCGGCGEVQWWKSDVPLSQRKASNPFGHDAYTSPKTVQTLASRKTLPALPSASPSLLIADDAEGAPNSSALALARVPSKDRP